jgi:heptosyltransferase-1
MAGWHSAVDKVIAVPLRAHKKTWWKLPALLSRLRRQLRAEHYDIVLDAQGLLKSALLARLTGVDVFGFHAGSARESLAARFYRKTVRVPEGLHVVEKNRQLVAALTRCCEASGAGEAASHPLPQAAGVASNVSRDVARLFNVDITRPSDFGLDEFRQRQMQVALNDELKEATVLPYLVLLHGTTWNSKYWPESSWLELIRLLTQQGWRCLLPWGNEEERQRAQRLQAASGENTRVLPRLSLTGLMSVVLHARAFISVETGIGHLAAVLDIPGIMLHGPTDPAYSGILGKSCRHITSGIDCSPCFKRDCPRLETSADIPPCQLLITPQQVYRDCLALLHANTGGAA